MKFFALTLNKGEILHILETDVTICSKYQAIKDEVSPRLWHGIWDTGATTTTIDQRIVTELGLVPIGKCRISTANGITDTYRYVIDVILPNHVTIENIMVSAANLGDDTDILIGMDIITLGDFSITNAGGETVFSFRTPSITTIDFCKPIRQTNE